jgi:hypothetical protein
MTGWVASAFLSPKMWRALRTSPTSLVRSSGRTGAAQSELCSGGRGLDSSAQISPTPAKRPQPVARSHSGNFWFRLPFDAPSDTKLMLNQFRFSANIALQSEAVNGNVKVSPKSSNQVLGVISAGRAEKLLTAWANDSGTGEFRRLIPYQDIIPRSAANLEALRQTHPLLRKAWSSSSMWHFDWYSWAAEMIFHERAVTRPAIIEKLNTVELIDVDRAESVTLVHWDIGTPPEAPSPIHAAFFYFRQNRDKILYCPNPACSAPYFFRTKKGQKFCSPECAKPSIGASKRRWWADNKSKTRRTS